MKKGLEEKSARHDMFSKRGIHPKVQEYNTLLAQLRVLEKEIDNLRREHGKDLKEEYIGTIVPMEKEEGFRVRLIPTKNTVKMYEEHLNLYGSVPKIPETIWSVVYYLKDNLLLHNHGGHIVLYHNKETFGRGAFDSFVELTESELETLNNGNIPSTLIHYTIVE
jgi:hypothetical protein